MEWQKSSYSADTGNCVEIAADGDWLRVRESEAPQVTLVVERASLHALLASVRSGRVPGTD